MNIIIQDIGRNNYNSAISETGLIYVLFYLQKKIYQASRECNMPLVHSLQKLLIASSSIQLLANQKTLSKSNDFVNLANQDRQVIEWCLQAEWKTRLYVRQDYCHVSSVRSFYLLSKAQIFCTHLDEKYLTHKLQCITWIEKKMISLLQKHNFMQYSEYSADNQIFASSKKCLMLNLLSMILAAGLQWTCFRQEKFNSSNLRLMLYYLKQDMYTCKHSNFSSFSVQLIDNFLYNMGTFYPHTKNCRLSCHRSSLNDLNQSCTRNPSISILFDYVKDILFHKDKIGRLRANHESFVRKHIQSVNSILSKWLECYKHLLSYKTILKIDKDIDKIIYRWTKKKSFISRRTSRHIAHKVSLLHKTLAKPNEKEPYEMKVSRTVLEERSRLKN